MRLFRIHLNPRCKEARRDLADPYQMHATLCRVFFPAQTPCPPGSLLWRLEPETDAEGRARVLIQSHETPDWSRLPVPEWLGQDEPGKTLAFDAIKAGQTFRFRLRANPSKTVQGKRVGLVHPDAQQEWLARKAKQHGFELPQPTTEEYFEFQQSLGGRAHQDVRISHEQMLSGRQHDGNVIRVYSVLFEGRLATTDAVRFKEALRTGIGHGKAMGLGMLSVI
ncbi:MAG: type I-E CRISPR-associated protein Cas6/Cse3/CasE, partial [Deltaproteobacteria bacterium HGW-Deltaproteobacteria-11]